MNRYSEPSTDIENYFKESISTRGSSNLPIVYRPLSNEISLDRYYSIAGYIPNFHVK